MENNNEKFSITKEFQERLINLINILNTIEVKGFDNLRNLGFTIQQLDNIIKMISQIAKQQQ